MHYIHSPYNHGHNIYAVRPVPIAMHCLWGRFYDQNRSFYQAYRDGYPCKKNEVVIHIYRTFCSTNFTSHLTFSRHVTDHPTTNMRSCQIFS